MRFVVLNGSPKGDVSVTMQYVRFIQKKFPNHEFLIHNISQRLSKIEEDKGSFKEIIQSIERQTGFYGPFLSTISLSIPIQAFHRAPMGKGSTEVFKDKYAAAFFHLDPFFDHIAHSYVNAICDDLSMRFFGGYSADMYDLLKERERERLLAFFYGFFEATQNKIPNLEKPSASDSYPFGVCPWTSQGGFTGDRKRIVILHDIKDPQSNAAG